MASAFGQQIHERRLDLTARLIKKLLNVKPDDENYELALDFCLQKEYYHSFTDVSPTTVESFYISVIKRLQEDSQLSKASALSALTTRFVAHTLTSVTTELNHNLLQLLASLAGQPLDSVLETTPQLLSAVYQSAEDATQQAGHHQHALLQRLKQLAVASVSGSDSSRCASPAQSEYDPFSENSFLTSWESDAECHSSRALPTSTPEPATAAALAEQQIERETTNSDLSQSKAASEHVAACYLSCASLYGPHELQPGTAWPQPTAVLARIATTQVEQLPLMRPDPDCCFTEPYLAQQLLHLLQGHQVHGFVLSVDSKPSWQKADGAAAPSEQGLCGRILQQRFVPDPRVTSLTQSQTALHALLKDFAVVGTAAWQLRRLSAHLCHSSGEACISGNAADHITSQAFTRTHTVGGMSVTPCLRALGVAVQHQLDIIGQCLCQLHQGGSIRSAALTATAADTNVAGQQRDWSLLMVKQQTVSIRHRLLLLHDAVFEVLHQLGGSRACVSSALLDGLHKKASAAATGFSGWQGAADAAALLHLLLCSCLPMVAAMAQWLWSAADGTGTASCGGAEQSIQSRQHTSKHHRPQHMNQGVSVCCDDFFIIKKSDVTATDASFWHEAYGVSTASCLPTGGSMPCARDSCNQHGEVAHDLIACPSFIRPLVSSILTAGKSVRLLEYMEQEELRQNLWGAARPHTATTAAAAPAPAAMPQDNSSNLQLAVRPSNSSSRPARSGSNGRSSMRRRWGDATSTAAAAISDINAAAAGLASQVRLQLAMATAGAGQQGQQQLAFDFINVANCMLRRSQQTLQQQEVQSGMASLADTATTAQQKSSLLTAGDVMSRALQTAGAHLAQPCGALGVLACGRAAVLCSQPAPTGLRQALLQARARRTAPLGADAAGGNKQGTSTLATVSDKALPEQQQQQDLHQHSDAHSHSKCTVVDAGDVLQRTTDPACCAGHSSQQNTAAVHHGMLGLVQQQQQLESKLSAVGSWLQHVAPWQQQQPGSKGTEPAGSSNARITADAAASGLGLLSSRGVPGSIPGSLAELWPLNPSGAAGKVLLQQQQQGYEQLQDEGVDPVWRAGGAWPCEQLSWLLVNPPQQMMPLSQLLDQALLQPVQARVTLANKPYLFLQTHSLPANN